MHLKITNRCGMGCTHCMENSLPLTDTFMTMETFRAALAFTRRIEEAAWMLGCAPAILLSGGEPTEHPEIVEMLSLLVKERFVPVLISNGMFLADEKLREAILRPSWRSLMVQVTHDPRYYPSRPPPEIEDDRVEYRRSLGGMLPLGRFKPADRAGEVLRQGPTSFNLRSAGLHFRDFAAAVCARRLASGVTGNGNCAPSITHEGDVVAGESRFCWKLGTVHSTNEELTRAILGMGSCNRCGLETGLTLPQKRAIGLTSLFGPDE